jgi:hypothetical protein
MDELLANLKHFVPALGAIQMLPGCGHWTQQERPSEVNAAMIDFLRSLPSSAPLGCVSRDRKSAARHHRAARLGFVGAP